MGHVVFTASVLIMNGIMALCLTGPHYWWATLGPSSTGLYSVEDEDLHNFNGSESQYAIFSEAVQGSFATVTP